MQSTTPILLTCLQARFILSPDEKFKSTGEISHIEYEKDFNSYKSALIKRSETPHIKAVIAFFNREVFGDNSSSAVEDYDGEADKETDETDAILAALDEIADSDDDETYEEEAVHDTTYTSGMLILPFVSETAK